MLPWAGAVMSFASGEGKSPRAGRNGGKGNRTATASFSSWHWCAFSGEGCKIKEKSRGKSRK